MLFDKILYQLNCCNCLFHSAIFHFHTLLVILLALAGWWLCKRDANYSRA